MMTIEEAQAAVDKAMDDYAKVLWESDHMVVTGYVALFSSVDMNDDCSEPHTLYGSTILRSSQPIHVSMGLFAVAVEVFSFKPNEPDE